MPGTVSTAKDRTNPGLQLGNTHGNEGVDWASKSDDSTAGDSENEQPKDSWRLVSRTLSQHDHGQQDRKQRTERQIRQPNSCSRKHRSENGRNEVPNRQTEHAQSHYPQRSKRVGGLIPDVSCRQEIPVGRDVNGQFGHHGYTDPPDRLGLPVVTISSKQPAWKLRGTNEGNEQS